MKKTKEFKSLFEYYGFVKSDEKKYPVVSKILKQLTPKRIKKEIERIKEIKLSTELQRLVVEYEKVGHRKDFIWKWTNLLTEKLTPDCLSSGYKESVLAAKLSSIIINAMIDDIADEKKNKKMWEASLNMFFFKEQYQKDIKKFKGENENYLILIEKIRIFLIEKIQKYPRYEEFKEIFLYDYWQFFNATYYGYLINKNINLINLSECKIYFPPNMQIMVLLTIDLMASPKFKASELGIVRDMFWKIQTMGRIGNSTTTFIREIDENDFSSDIFAYMISSGFLKREDLKKENKKELIKKINKVKASKQMLIEWEKNYQEIQKYKKIIKSFDVKKIISAAESLIIGHLTSEGFK